MRFLLAPRRPLFSASWLGVATASGLCLSACLALCAFPACGDVKTDTDAGDIPDIDAAPGGPDASLADAQEGVPDAMPDATSTDCEPDSVTCETDTLITCSSTGTIESSEVCALDCFSDGTRCNDLDPSNGLADQLDDAASAPDVTLAAGATINTDDGTITGTAVAVPTEIVSATLVDVLVVKVGSLTAADITVSGSNALAIVSDGDVTITGAVDLSAHYNHGGPGSLLGRADCRGGNGISQTDAVSGGGGGGFGTAGGSGGAAGFLVGGGDGGGPDGTASLVPLRGGCEGGWAGGGSGPPPDSDTSTSPGTGGGAIQISSRTRIAVGAGGFVVANGASAKADTGIYPIFCIAGAPCGPGNGAGSGGGILLEAPEVTVAASGGLVANGGAGHCGTKGSATAPTASETPAPGTDCTNFAGGDGAAGAVAAQNGTGETEGGATGAGGGGGAGRVRVNLPSGSEFSPPGGAVVSPAATVGVLGTR